MKFRCKNFYGFGWLPPYAEKANSSFRNCYETERARALLK